MWFPADSHRKISGRNARQIVDLKKNHLEITSQKLKSRNNMLRKLAGTVWGATAPVLRATLLAMCYSAAEWSRSTHVKNIALQPNKRDSGNDLWFNQAYALMVAVNYT